MKREEHPLQKFHSEVRPFLQSKAEEFALFGYDQVKEADLWKFLMKKKWKKMKEEKHLHEVVSDILAVSIGEFMNFATVEAFQEPSSLKNGDFGDLQKLFK